MSWVRCLGCGAQSGHRLREGGVTEGRAQGLRLSTLLKVVPPEPPGWKRPACSCGARGHPSRVHLSSAWGCCLLAPASPWRVAFPRPAGSPALQPGQSPASLHPTPDSSLWALLPDGPPTGNPALSLCPPRLLFPIPQTVPTPGACSPGFGSQEHLSAPSWATEETPESPPLTSAVSLLRGLTGVMA